MTAHNRIEISTFWCEYQKCYVNQCPNRNTTGYCPYDCIGKTTPQVIYEANT